MQRCLFHGSTLTCEFSFEEYEPLPAVFLKMKKVFLRILAFSNLLVKYQLDPSSARLKVMVIVACWNVAWTRLLTHTHVTSYRVFCSFLCTLITISFGAHRGLESRTVEKLNVAWPAAVVCAAAITPQYQWLVQLCRTPSAGLEKSAALPVLYFVRGGSERLANLRRARSLFLSLQSRERSACVIQCSERGRAVKNCIVTCARLKSRFPF